ncbi:MAG TPA: hypothetical protein DEA22_06165 [Blastocatellia bacterium]|nr:hypothetical protein [Blastocatellia bacterium]
MKILRIIARLNVGGPARHVVWLTAGLNDNEFRSALIAGSVPAGEGDMAYFAEENGVRPMFIAEMSRELSLRDIVSLFKVYREIKRFRPDVIHTHTAKAGTIGRTAAFFYRWFTAGVFVGRPRRIRVFHTFHGHVFHSYYGRWKTALFILIERFLAFAATDKIIVITPQQLDEINGRFKVGRRGQFEVVRLGIELGSFADGTEMRSRFRAAIAAADNEILVGLIGRLTEIKNIPMFLRAAELCRDDKSAEGARIRFIIVGDGHLRKNLEAETAHRGLGDSVLFLGNRDDIEEVYAGIDIVALTSTNEGTPLSLIEGMASARPVISTSVGGVKDLLGDEIETCNGFTICRRGLGIASGNAEGFSSGLIYLAKNEKLRESLGQAGKSFIKANYSKERLIEDIRTLYRSGQ